MHGKHMTKLKSFINSGHYGVDKEGRIVIIENIASYDTKSLYEQFTKEDIEDYLI